MNKSKPANSTPVNRGSSWYIVAAACRSAKRDRITADYRISDLGFRLRIMERVEAFYQIIRGGSWNFDAVNCRSAIRNHYSADNHNGSLGFRLTLKPTR